MTARSSPTATLFPLLLAGLLAGMSYWLEIASRAATGANDGKTRHDPDYIIQNFEVRRFNPQGQLQHTVVADRMRHYPDDDSTVVTMPRITYHRNPPTFISAREALVSSKGEHVTLIDDVHVRRSGIDNKPDTILTTSRLEAWPDDEIAQTDVPVTITQGKTNVQGSGLQADNKTSIYTLEGPVRGIFYRKDNTAADNPTIQAPQAAPVTPSAAATTLTQSAEAAAKPQAKPKPKPVAKANAKARTKASSKLKTNTSPKTKPNR